MKGVVRVGEGGDVEVFWNCMVKFSLCDWFTERKQLHLAIGVGDFGDGSEGFAVTTVYVVERNWIECVTKHAGESDQENFCIGGDNGAFFS